MNKDAKITGFGGIILLDSFLTEGCKNESENGKYVSVVVRPLPLC